VSVTDTYLELELVGRRERYISGVVLDESDRPIQNYVWVVARCDESPVPYCRATAWSGEFELGPLAEGTYELSTRAVPKGFAKVALAGIEAGSGDVVLRLPPGGSLSGTLVRAGSRLPREGKLRLSRSDEPDGPTFANWYATHAGEFHIAGLVEGLYSVMVRSDPGLVGTAMALVTGTGETSGVEIEMAPAATLRITLTDESEFEALRIWQDRVLVESFSTAWRGTRPLWVPPGRLRVEWTTSDGAREQWLDLPSGEEREVVIGDRR
jgi:hypothetical protein